MTDLYDPSEHTVDEVVAYLETADGDEVTRVQDAERAGKGRKGVLAFGAQPASDDGYTRRVVDGYPTPDDEE